MAEPFKNLFNEKLIRNMGRHLKISWPDFDEAGFIAAATDKLDQLELKQRSQQITRVMEQFLPQDFGHAGQIMLDSLGQELSDDLSADEDDESGLVGWAIMPMVDYVGLHGLDDFDLSMTLFKELTKRFSSEFGIRYFLTAKPKESLSVLHQWTMDSNHHVRRLVSEGSRPRLPWGIRLNNFIEDPLQVIELLEKLKDDESEYVRRSVANSLNDISKDHPELVAEIAEQWLVDASHQRERLIRHACRSLIKQGHKKTLQVLGYCKPRLASCDLQLHATEVQYGDALYISVSLQSGAKKEQPLIIDYIIHHQKANGETSPKVFKWRTTTLNSDQPLHLKKKHAIKPITTRVYYPGEHHVEIVVNGVSVARKSFELLM